MADSDINLNQLYRPSTVKEYVSTKTVQDQVHSLLNRKNRPKFIIISGESGLGKTTLARILCKEYRCEKPNGKTCSAQGYVGKQRCASCKLYDLYIKSGNYDDIQNLVELDVGKYSRISDIRDLLDEINQGNLGSYTTLKEVILDEAQSLSSRAQDALLKQLEEPDQDVLMIMCTTAIDKIQNTITNRAESVIRLQAPSVKDIVLRLTDICKQEKIRYSQQGLTLIATRYNSRIRNAVQTLDNVQNQYGEVTEDSVSKMLTVGGVTTDTYFEYMHGVLDPVHKAKALNALHRVRTLSDFDTFSRGLIDFVRRGIYVKNGILVDGVLESEMEAYAKLLAPLTVKQSSFLLNRLQSIDKGDIEINLISLLYSNLEVLSTEEPKEVIKPLEKEQQNEAKSQEEDRRDREKASKDELDQQVTDLNKPVDQDEMMKELGLGS